MKRVLPHQRPSSHQLFKRFIVQSSITPSARELKWNVTELELNDQRSSTFVALDRWTTSSSPSRNEFESQFASVKVALMTPPRQSVFSSRQVPPDFQGVMLLVYGVRGERSQRAHVVIWWPQVGCPVNSRTNCVLRCLQDLMSLTCRLWLENVPDRHHKDLQPSQWFKDREVSQ